MNSDAEMGTASVEQSSEPSSAADSSETSAVHDSETAANTEQASWDWSAWDGNESKIPQEYSPVWKAAYGHAERMFQEEMDLFKSLVEAPDTQPMNKTAHDFQEYKDALSQLSEWEKKHGEISGKYSEMEAKFKELEAKHAETSWVYDYYQKVEVEEWAGNLLSQHAEALKNPNEKAFVVDLVTRGFDPDQAFRLVGQPKRIREEAINMVVQGSSYKFAVDTALRNRQKVVIPEVKRDSSPRLVNPVRQDLSDPKLSTGDALKIALARAKTQGA